MTSLRIAAAIAACAAALALPACGSGDDEPASDTAAPEATNTPTPESRGFSY